MICKLCDSEAAWSGWDRDPSDTSANRIVVCGSHMVSGDIELEGRR